MVLENLTKRVIGFFCAVIILALMTTGSYAQVVINVNGDFSNAVAGQTGGIQNWALQGTAYADYRVVQDPDDPSNLVLRVELTSLESGGNPINAWDVQALHQNTMLTAGTNYRVSIRVRAENPDNGTIQIDGGSGAQLWGQSVSGGTWQTLQTGIFSPAASGTRQIAIHFSHQNNQVGQVFYIDDLFVTDLDAIPGDDDDDRIVIASWDFEDQNQGGWVSGAGGASIQISNERADNSIYAIKMIGADNHLEVNLQNDNIGSLGIQPGDAVSMRIWISAGHLAAVNGFQGFWHNEDWGWKSSWIGKQGVSGGSWSTLEWTMGDVVEPLRRIGMQLLLSSGNEEVQPVLFVDNIRILREAEPPPPPPPPPPPYEGPPLAHLYDKFLGNVYSSSQEPNFANYWNQVTPENGGKWGSVESTRGVMNWTELDAAYNLAKDNGYPFRFHVLIWGSQQPSWMPALAGNPAEQLSAITAWFEAVAARYPDIDYLEVVNEPISDPPGPGKANYIEALGGAGETGWDWVITAFEMAREIFPSSVKLMINEYGILSGGSKAAQYRGIIDLLNERGLIDAIGVQGHAFSTRVPTSVMSGALDLLAETGLPVQVTEMDVDGNTYQNPDLTPEESDAIQLADYQRIFPVLWEHPAVEGITLWGWRPGMWRTPQEAYLIRQSGHERPALEWLREYLNDYNFAITVNYIIYVIENLPDSAIRHPVAQRRSTLINKFETALAGIESGDYRGMSNKLQNDVLEKIGGRNPRNDWVTDPAAHAVLRPLIIGVISKLTELAAKDLAHENAGIRADISSGMPERYDIEQNYPNPFNPVTTIRYQIPEDEHVTLTVYNMLGQAVKVLVDRHQSAGYYSIVWDGRNNNGAGLSSGMYFYRIQAGGFTDMKPMIYIK